MKNIIIDGDVIVQGLKKTELVDLIVNMGFEKDFANDVRNLPKNMTFKIANNKLGQLKITKIKRRVYELNFSKLKVKK